ncbi:hypothetical protein GAYE_SCF48G6000 [Galdieria yellowstonensis]|uniref:50S ribosomal protein L10 n=1 Tax=Galdieria yellowstonensis TaxID=3028027 RepID=A0AAV9ILZ4_9RHOD|nr:hypothetical protein GAYE_SCF48G6000 [Galdieria yellowstonensis]
MRKSCTCSSLFVSTTTTTTTSISSNSFTQKGCNHSIHRKLYYSRCATRRSAFQAWKLVSPAVLEKKQNVVKQVKDLLLHSSVIVSFPTEGYTHKELSDLRRRLQQVKLKVVKNTLMKRAIEETPFQCLESHLKGTNAWIFLPDDFKPSIEEFETAHRELKKEFQYRYGVLDTRVFSGDDLKAVLKLPSKKELMAQIAFAIQSVHTSLAVSIHQIPTKLARAIYLAKELDKSAEASLEEEK